MVDNTIYVDIFWQNIEPLFHLFLPSNLSLFECFVIIGLLFGVVVWFIRFLKGENKL